MAMFGSPVQVRVVQRHPILAPVTVIAKRFSIVAAGAIGFFTLRIKAMSVLIIEIVNAAGQIVAAMTTYAKNLLLMTGPAPLRLNRGLFGMLMPPADWVDIGKGGLSGMTETTVPTGAHAIMTTHAQWLARYDRIERSCGALAGRGMASLTDNFVIQVALMIEQRPQSGLDGRGRIIGVAVALPAVFIIFDIMAGGALIHRGEVAIVGVRARCNRNMTGDTLNLLIRHVQGMRENQI
jgi:hypothetical protein